MVWNRHSRLRTVGDGATLTIVGNGFSATALGGGGTITGDVELVGDGGFRAVVSGDGSVQTLTVSGNAKIDGGTVALEGDVQALLPGSYVILQADALQDGGGQWAVSGLPSRYVGTVSVVANSLRLSIDRRGSVIILR